VGGVERERGSDTIRSTEVMGNRGRRGVKGVGEGGIGESV